MTDAKLAKLAIPEMVETGAFGPRRRFVSFEPDDRFAGKDQFASTVLYGTLTVTVDDDEDAGSTRQHRLVLKLKHQEEWLRLFFRNDDQFHNETLFYGRVLPFMAACVPADEGSPRSNRLPTLSVYFHGRNDCGDRADRDLIVLENAQLHGYRMSDQRLFLDFDHVVVALKTLAKFHGLSYRAKHVDAIQFAKLVAGIKDTQWSPDGQWTIRDGGLKKLIDVPLMRLEERRNGGEQDERIRRFRSGLLADTDGALWRLMQPREPLAVLCHGDFNRNNMLFRYDREVNGSRPVDALVFDMATVRYGSPALDLSFFLYMNTSRQLRNDRWDDLLDVYCETLADCLSDVVGVSVPNRAQLDAEMCDHAFYGLAHASFFIRVMMEDYESRDPSAYCGASAEEIVNILLKCGGDRATDLVADVLEHIIDTGYTKSIPASSLQI